MAVLFPLQADRAGVVVIMPVTLSGVTNIDVSKRYSYLGACSPRSSSTFIPMDLVSSDSSSQPDHPPQVTKSITQTKLDAREKAALSKTVAVDTVAHVTQIWGDRLQLISICASFFTAVDSLLFKLVSGKNGRSLTSKLVPSSLAGSLIFHAAAASVGYVGSLLLIRHRLSEAQAVPDKPDSGTVAITADVGPMNPCIFEPTVITSTQAPSTLESGGVRNVERSATSNAHPTSIPSTRIFSTTATGARSSLLPAITEGLVAHLHHPACLDVGMRRVSLFNLRAVVPCVGTQAVGGVSDHDSDAQVNAVALARLLNNCHGTCSCFMLVGFALFIVGVIGCLWEAFEPSGAIFGSACIAFCLVLGFGALR